MELYTIYEDTNIKIEILKILHDYLDRTTVKWVELSDAAKSILYGEVLEHLKPKFKEWKVEEKLTAARAVILESVYAITLSAPFDVFNRAVDFISLELVARKTIKEIEEEFNEIDLVDEGEIVVHFFDTAIFKVNGYLAYYKNGALLILLFSIKED